MIQEVMTSRTPNRTTQLDVGKPKSQPDAGELGLYAVLTVPRMPIGFFRVGCLLSLSVQGRLAVVIGRGSWPTPLRLIRGIRLAFCVGY